jgi:exodeoxyribonuclease VIII
MTTHDRNPEMDYYANSALSHSRLKEIRKSPGHFRWSLDNETPSTDAMNLGSLVHAMVLEPHTVEGRFVEMPKFDRRTKQGKADHIQWLNDHPASIPLPPSEWRTATGMAKAIADHPDAAAMIECVAAHGTAEAEYFWEDGRGIDRKAKVDGLCISEDETILVDLKTTIDASPDSFRRSIFKYSYATQMAYYREAVASEGKYSPRTAIIIAVGKTPPYAVGLYRFSEETLAKADMVVDRWLETYLQCTQSGKWPSYWDIQDVEMPDWFLTSNGVDQ